MRTGNAKVDKMAEMNFVGNIIPRNWYHTIVKDTGKPYLTAIIILADVVYWYRPTEIFDTTNNSVKGYKKKFESDLLMRSYEQLSRMYGISKREATDAVVFLEKLGAIKRVFRTIKTENTTMNNVLFIDVDPDCIKKLTFGEENEDNDLRDTCHANTGTLSRNYGTPITQIRETNTKNTTKITTENNNIGDCESACASLTSCSNIFRVYEEEIGILSPTVSEALKDLINEFGDELVEYAIKESAKSNARSVRYIEGILNNLRQRNITTVSEAKSESNKVRKENKMTDYEKEVKEYEEILKNNKGVMFF